MLPTQGYGTSGALATQGYPHGATIVRVILELRSLGVDFGKSIDLTPQFQKLNALTALFEAVLESQAGNIGGGPPPTPTPTVEIRQITGTFEKSMGLVAEFEYSGKLSALMEKIIESHSGDTGGSAPPTPTPTVEIRELTGTFEKAAALTIIFDKTMRLKALFELATEDTP